MVNQRVLVTGASRGIGKAITQALVPMGFTVLGTSRHPEKITERVGGVEYLALDLSVESSIEECIKKAGYIDILINNAGISQIGPAEELPLEKYREILQINVLGPIRLIQGFLPGMKENNHGFIINIGSLAGKFAVPFQSSYVASKFALAGFSWSLRNEVKAHGIKVVVIEPNDINTSIEPEIFSPYHSAYKDAMNKVMVARGKSMYNSPGPEIVANKVAEILKNSNSTPAPFVTVGNSAARLVFFRRFVPDKIIEKLINITYGLD